MESKKSIYVQDFMGEEESNEDGIGATNKDAGDLSTFDIKKIISEFVIK